jgi:hypothetical protein
MPRPVLDATVGYLRIKAASGGSEAADRHADIDQPSENALQ